ncbi:translation initiation factor IF-2 [Candidatus Micrarchaeota archaeon]|nr:translation initiation factor IF-2 [Candidatus Micrarchaeota archaeon]
MIRQPIVVVMGHVDHGKTSLLDRIRKTSVAKREKGGITQHIGASEVPVEVITKACSAMMSLMQTKLEIPGLLFIDTPGHAAFTNLRERGGSISDMAVVVLDVTKGFEPQTLETIEILKDYKTPFVIAMNKIDLIEGWVSHPDSTFLESFNAQPPEVQQELEKRLYNFVGRLSELGFQSERFDRVSDFTKQIAIIPISAKTGEGVNELLMFIAGLSQRFLKDRLHLKVKGAGRGSILEVKDETGLGKTVDAIFYDGVVKRGDTIVFGTVNGAKTTKVRALLRPKPLDEMRDPREKFLNVEEVHAAAGVKIAAPGLEDAIAGSPVFVAGKTDEKKLKNEIDKEIREVLIEKGPDGVILKADTLGSLEAIVKLLKGEKVPVSKAGIGAVVKKDVVDASGIRSQNRYYGVILSFNVDVLENAEEEARRAGVTILKEGIIYALLDNYKKWVEGEKEQERTQMFSSLTLPAKLKVMAGCCFRASHPAIFGVDVQAGRIKPEYELINDKGVSIGRVKSIQSEKESIAEAKEGMQVAISMDEPTFGRQVNEGDVLYSNVPRTHAKMLISKYKEFLNPKEIELLGKIRGILGDMYVTSSHD